MKKIVEAYKFFNLDYDAKPEEVERSALNKTRQIQKKYASNANKITEKLNLLNEYKKQVYLNIETSKLAKKERRYTVDTSSIFTLLGILIFVIAICAISFNLLK